ncbi:hypothetical protein PUR71_31495 [Streptomyces sp. SP17BM10]|uniref:hypothetical protein n=1 Tax=Streptomyces sp. SP17BM10 TaxID=3002530 RepID=UPI002E75AC81|nr:hypothetical protein [Streptomyces sp. SP17BM10]MEE1787394.1 hypothetical protein [Streptomyces sp. SP17BM10]
MAVIAVAGGPGAPGATTSALALLLAWPLEPGRRILLVEADPDGGAVLAGALEGRVEAVYGLRNLAIADRRGLLAQTLWEQLVDLSPDGTADRLLLPGLTDPSQAPGLAYTWEPLAEVLHGLEQQGYDVIVDLGRSGATGASAVLARRADVVVATVRTTLRGLSAARPRLAALAEDLATAGTGADALGLLLVAEGPYSGAEVSREFGLPVLGLLPHAVRTARVLSDGGDITDRRFIRSELMRTARSAADEAQLAVRRRRQRLSPAQAGPVATPAPAAVAAPSGVGSEQRPYAQARLQSAVESSERSQAQPQFHSHSHSQPQPQPQPQPPPPPFPSPPQPVAPVIVTGPVAPLAGLAPQPAAPAPFPGQVPAAYGHQAYEQQGHGQQAQQPYAQQPYAQQPHAPQQQVPEQHVQEPDPHQEQQPPVNGRPHGPGEVLRAR